MMLQIAAPGMPGEERSREQVTVFECHLKFIFIILIVTGKVSPSRPDYAGREKIRT